MRNLLASPPFHLFATRNRASYYQPPRRFPPAFIRRFFLRYPRAPIWGMVILAGGSFVAPTMYHVFMYFALTPEEFYKYRTEQSAIVLLRQKYGQNLWFPSFLVNWFTPPTKEDESLLD